MSGTTWTRFFWSDWLSDLGLRRCSLAARGLWMDMLAIAAAHDPIGYVAVNGVGLDEGDIARMVGAEREVVADLLKELDINGVFTRDRRGTIYSRRMISDAKRSRTNSENGKKGGNPNLGKDRGNSGSVRPHMENPLPINQNPESINPTIPDPAAREGGGGKGIEKHQAIMLARRILDGSPDAVKADGEGKLTKIGGALMAMQKRGHDPATIANALAAYYADGDQQREGGRWAKRLPGAIWDMVWEPYVGSSHLRVAVDNTPPKPKVVWFEDRAWQVPAGRNSSPIDDEPGDPGIVTQFAWMQRWTMVGPHTWDARRGPPPDEDGCVIWPEVLEHFAAQQRKEA